MNRAFSTIVLLAVFWVSGRVGAEEHQLLRPDPTNSMSEVVASDTWAARSAYFGKRSKLARIDIATLLSDQPFVVQLFDRSRVTLKKRRIDQHVPNSWVWVGEQVSPRRPVWTNRSAEMDPESRRKLEVDAHTVEFLIIRNDHSEKPPSAQTVDEAIGAPGSTEALNPLQPHDPAVFGAVGESPRVSTDSELSLPHLTGSYSIKGRISTPGLNHEYAIEAVDSIEGLHLVIEIDPEKAFYPLEVGVGHESEQNRSRRERYEEFLRQQIEDKGSRQ